MNCKFQLYFLLFLLCFRKKDCEALNTGGEQWNRVMDAFSTLFLSEGPGYERDSFLAIKAGASGRIAR